jgi:hypothetical protein
MQDSKPCILREAIEIKENETLKLVGLKMVNE